MSCDIKTSKPAGGFSLIEVLVTLLVFWLGMLGIALYLANGLKDTAANQARATTMHAVWQATEPVLYHTRSDCLATALKTFPRNVTTDNGKDSYAVRLIKAVDGTGAIIATAGAAPAYTVSTTDPAGWTSPVTIVLAVPVANTTYTAYPSYTIVLQNYTVACNA